MPILYILLALLAAYLLGSIPTALWVGRRFFGLADIREHGSGNAGATNTFRVLGPKAGSFVLLVDALKGFVAAFFLPQWLVAQGAIAAEHELYYRLACGALAVVGHIYPVFAQFRGGKGVATILGMMLGVAPATVCLCILVFIVIAVIADGATGAPWSGCRSVCETRPTCQSCTTILPPAARTAWVTFFQLSSCSVA